MKSEFDLVVIGGGPAGSTLACLAKKYNPGRRILILERDRFPRHHVGESTLPGMLPILDELGVTEKIANCGFVRKVGAVYVRRGQRPWSVPFRTTHSDRGRPAPPAKDYAWQVRRAQYDKVLLDHARESGVEAREGWAVRRTRLPSAADHPAILTVADPSGRELDIEAGIVADCSGQGGVLSRQLKVRSRLPELSNMAVYAYYRCDPFAHPHSGLFEESKIVLRYLRDGWLWFIPLSREIASVGFVCRRERLTNVAREGGLAALLDDRI